MNSGVPTGSLVQCPKCFQDGKLQYLGRILDTGELLVLRFHHGTTLIKADNYTLTCGCGFAFNISGTVVQHEAIAI